MILLEDADETALHDCSYDGGYVYGTSHSVMPGARPEKYRIMMQELRAGSHYTFIHQGSRQTMQSLIDVIR